MADGNSPPPVRISPKNIRYLAFEGGGGKGVAYIGALKALQELIRGKSGLASPLVRGGETNQIKGISGASAGAITAFLTAMGRSAQDIETIVGNAHFFTKLDEAKIGRRMVVLGNNQTSEKSDGKVSADILGTAEKVFESQGKGSDPVQDLLIDTFVRNQAKASFARILTSDIEGYCSSLSIDFGFFTGLKMFEFFAQCIDDVIRERNIRIQWNGKTLPFKEFYRLTSLVERSSTRLMIVGTNVSRMRSLYFSSEDTPEFPVAAAVLISMAIPAVFKPVWVNANVGKGSSQSSLYKGFWVDGGVLNNLPIHAFDASDESPYRTARSAAPGFVRAINPTMLGFQLMPGLPTEDDPVLPDVKSPSQTGLVEFCVDLLGTLLYPGSGGQMRSPEERDQVIDLYCGELETIDFSPEAGKSGDVQKRAYRSVMQYYQEKGVQYR